MMTILDYLSFFMIFASLGFAVCHPKVKFPIHIELIMFVVAIGVAAMLINAIKGHDLYGHLKDAEILVRFGLGVLVACFTYDYFKEHRE